MRTITLPLDEFLRWSTGHGETTIPQSWVPIVYAALNNNSPESGYFVQTTSFDGEPMQQPMLWRYGVWHSSQQNEERKKAYSQRQRELSFIFEANVKQAVPYVQKFFGVDKNIANIIATKYVRDNNEELLKMLGMDELIKDIKDV
jgi:hypothetical protein